MYGGDFPYENFASQFKAELFDPDHWAEVFAYSGAKYIVLTSKHHEGFAVWPSKEASATWGARGTRWRSVRSAIGLATSPRLCVAKACGWIITTRFTSGTTPLWLYDKPRYVREHMFPQFKDLVTHYKPSIIFSDGEWELPSADWHSAELLAWLYNESPVKDEVVVDDRWGSDTRHKHGGYWTTEYTAGMSGVEHPWEESRGMGVSYGQSLWKNATHRDGELAQGQRRGNLRRETLEEHASVDCRRGPDDRTSRVARGSPSAGGLGFEDKPVI